MAKPFQFFHTKVAVDDAAKPISVLTSQRVQLFNCDIQIQTNPVDMGDRANQNLELSVGDIYGNPLPNIPVDTQDVWVKNHSSGSTAYIVITGWFQN
jgi:hypothetical protein